MRRLMIGAASLCFALVLATSSASAQFYVGAGVTMPSGDYGEYAKTGWMAAAGYGIWSSSDEKLSFWVEGAYGSNSHDDEDDAKTNVMMGSGWIYYSLGDSEASMVPYIGAGGGYLNHQYKVGDFSESFGQAMFAGAGGVTFGDAFVEARYINGTDETTFLMFTLGYIF